MKAGMAGLRLQWQGEFVTVVDTDSPKLLKQHRFGKPGLLLVVTSSNGQLVWVKEEDCR